jgi:hypothetical protein
MNFSSKFPLFAPLTFTVDGVEITGIVNAVIAGEVGPSTYGIFYFAETDDGTLYEVEECTMNGSLR